MLESTLSCVTTFYQVPCGCQGYSFQFTLHASIPGWQGPVSSWRPSCSRKETVLLYVRSVKWICFLFCLLWFRYLLPVVSLADLLDVVFWRPLLLLHQVMLSAILFLCQWVCSCVLRTRWRGNIFIYFILSDGLLLMETTRLVGCCDSTCGPDGGIAASPFGGK